MYPVNEPADVLVDEQFVNRGLFVDVDHPVSGPQRQIGAPWRMADGGFRVRRPAHLRPAHDEILIGELGLDAERRGRASVTGGQLRCQPCRSTASESST